MSNNMKKPESRDQPTDSEKPELEYPGSLFDCSLVDTPLINTDLFQSKRMFPKTQI